MPDLALKDIPAELHLRLKARAAANHRSLSGEILAILEAAVADRAGPVSLARFDALRVKPDRRIDAELLDLARVLGGP